MSELSFTLVMYRYADGNGNVFVLQSEDESRLCLEAAAANGPATAKTETQLSQTEYMRLISAFSLAIDNQVCHCELRNKNNGMIIALEDGQQRRYILSQDSRERLELEGLLCDCIQRA